MRNFGIMAAVLAGLAASGPALAQTSAEQPAGDQPYSMRTAEGARAGVEQPSQQAQSRGQSQATDQAQATDQSQAAGRNEELLSDPTPQRSIEAAENEASAVEQLAQTREALGGEIPVQGETPQLDAALDSAEEMKDDQHRAVDRIQASD